MSATEELKKEHRGIEIMLKIAGAVANKLETGEKVPAQHLSQIVEFLQIFADKCHHGKEEDRLFTALEQTGFAPFAGPIHVMLEEHKQGRTYIKAMAEAAKNYETDRKKYGALFAENARGYIALLAQHIEKEDLFCLPPRKTENLKQPPCKGLLRYYP